MDLKDVFSVPGSMNLTIKRTSRRKKKSHNSDKRKNNSLAIDKNPFIHNTYIRWERILRRIPNISDYPSMKYSERLAGGADKEAGDVDKIVTQSEVNKIAPNGSSVRLGVPLIHENQALLHNSKSIRNKNVDEMIDCAIKNLQEAGKALVAFGENHEHELKLMVKDLLAKFQKWIDAVQKKMDAAKYDVNNIQKTHAAQKVTLTAKDRELAVLQATLAECQAAKAAYKKALTELSLQDQSRAVEHQSKTEDTIDLDLSASISAINPSTFSHHSLSKSIVQPEIVGSRLGDVVGQSTAKDFSVLNDKHAESYQTAISFSDTLKDNQIMTSAIDNSKYAKARPSWVAIAHKLSHNHIHFSDSPEKRTLLSQQETPRSKLPSDSVSIIEPIEKPQYRSQQSQASTVPLQQHPVLSSKVNPTATSTLITIGDTAAISASPHVTAAPLMFDRDGDKEQDGRIVQLEAELIQLRNENERIKRDHAEYENSIQRALLQGISLLNAEALKALKNPPFICYKPCEPCNSSQLPSLSNIIESVPCTSRAPNNNMSQRRGKSASSKVGELCYAHEDIEHPSLRKQATCICYAPAKKSSRNSMLLLPPQKHIHCAYTAVLQDYCNCTNYGRAMRLCPRDKVHYAPRVAARRDGLRNGAMRTHVCTLERREPPCSKNRKFISD